MSSAAMSVFKLASLLGAAVLLTACGGGGGGGSSGSGGGTITPTLLSTNTLKAGGFTRSSNGSLQHGALTQGRSTASAEKIAAVTTGTPTPQRLKITEGTTSVTYDVNGAVGVADAFGFGKVTTYSGAVSTGETTIISQTDVANRDKFFFFDVVQTGNVGDGGYRAVFNSLGTQGDLTTAVAATSSATSPKVLTPTTAFTNGVASFVGKGTLDGRVHTVSGTTYTEALRYGGSGNLTMTVNSATGKVSGQIANISLINTNGYTPVTDLNGTGKVVLNETSLDGAKFNVGSIALKNNAGADVAAFTAANSSYAGGVYGLNADHVAGTYSGIAPLTGSANQVLWLEGMFYGDRQ